MCAVPLHPHPVTLREALTAATTRFAADEHLRGQASRDAELLLLHTLDITRVALLTNSGRELTPDQQIRYEVAIDRRLRYEPIQYITGQQEFYGLALAVTPAVLIPRPETELMVEAVLKLLPTDQPLKIADIGTGSGAIAIALATHLPRAEITALDISAEALAVATANALVHDVAGRIRLLQSDLLSAVDLGAAAFDAIVSNPPYVPDSDRETLHPEVRDYEPATALFAGESGLDVYRRLIPQAGSALKAGGLLAMEIGHGQRPAVAALLRQWDDVSFIKDLQLIPRVVLARSPLDSVTIR
jgi:release factor glutamine methyltransferase